MTSTGGDAEPKSASMAPPLSLEHVRKELELLHRSWHRTLRSALYAQVDEPAEGRDLKVKTVEGKEHSFRVVVTRGELDLRRKLVAEEENQPTVYIVPFARSLPRDLEASFATGRVWWPQEEWTLPRRFGARAATARLMASKLRQVAQRDAGPDYATGDAPSVDLEEAWLVFLRKRLGVAVLETESQLLWATLNDRDGRGKPLGALLESVDGSRKELADVLARRLGASAPLIVGAWLEESSVELAAMALVGEATREALTPGHASFGALTIALEMRIAHGDKHPLRSVQAQEKAEGVAKALVELGQLVTPLWDRFEARTSDPLARAIVKTAESLLEKEQLRPLAMTSNRLELVFESRREAFEKAVLAMAGATAPAAMVAALSAVDRAAAELQRHERTKADPVLGQQIDMASRLAAFLTERVPDVVASPRAEVIQLARFQLEVGGWIDWARQMTRADASGPLGKSLLGLVARVDRVRDGLDARFAAAYARTVGEQGHRAMLAGAENIAGVTGKALPIEDALATMALELLEKQPRLRLLVLCMDGMSTANLAELWTSTSHGSLVPVSQGPRWPVLAHVPTLTKLSRAALFAGHTLAPGDSTDTSRDGERMAKHPVMVRMGEKATVLLRAEMLGAGGGLSDDAAKAVRSEQRVVAVVVNAIDDQLKGSAQIRVAVSGKTILPFAPLLDAAESAGRLVLLSSDHGNVSWNRFPGGPPAPPKSPVEGAERGARHRMLGPSEKPTEHEIVLASGALSAPAGVSRVAVAVSETVRYSSLLHAGEHGGASLAEVVAPFVLLAPRGLLPELAELGVTEAPLEPPRFWNREDLSVPESVAPVVAPKAKALVELKASQAAQTSLPFPGQSADLAGVLFKTKLFREQTRNVGETELAEIKRATELLLREGGKVSWERFASELGLGRPVRVPGFVDRLERVLNYGGDAAVEANRSTQRVTIDRPLLDEIFLGDEDG